MKTVHHRGVILYTKYPKNSTKTITNEFSKTAGHKIDVQKQVMFLLSNKLFEKEINSLHSSIENN